MALHRDHYEGTPFDMTGPAAGPFGCPYRYYGPFDGSGITGHQDNPPQGAWERPISVHYTGYVNVNQGRSWLPDPLGGICWSGLNRSSETCFVPFYCGISDLPLSYQTCSTAEFSRESAWWAFNSVAELSTFKYSYIREDIEDRQKEI